MCGHALGFMHCFKLQRRGDPAPFCKENHALDEWFKRAYGDEEENSLC